VRNKARRNRGKQTSVSIASLTLGAGVRRIPPRFAQH
jgi:hypothetical protein